MQAYRIINSNNLKWEFITGIPNAENNEVFAKFNRGLSKVRPYNHAVPYPRRSMFAIMNKTGLNYFLFNLCEFTLDDLKFLQSSGYKVVDEELSVYSSGFSKLFCTYFEDEIVELKEVDFTSIYTNADSVKNIEVKNSNILPEDIRYCKNTYYKDVVFNA